MPNDLEDGGRKNSRKSPSTVGLRDFIATVLLATFAGVATFFLTFGGMSFSMTLLSSLAAMTLTVVVIRAAVSSKGRTSHSNPTLKHAEPAHSKSEAPLTARHDRSSTLDGTDVHPGCLTATIVCVSLVVAVVIILVVVLLVLSNLEIR